jgi:hypothetical protein
VFEKAKGRRPKEPMKNKASDWAVQEKKVKLMSKLKFSIRN